MSCAVMAGPEPGPVRGSGIRSAMVVFRDEGRHRPPHDAIAAMDGAGDGAAVRSMLISADEPGAFLLLLDELTML